MNILTLDLATQTGFAMGHPPAELSDLNSASILLSLAKKEECPVKKLTRMALGLEAFFEDVFMFKDSWPDLVVYEAPMDPQAKHKNEEGESAGRQSHALLLPWSLACKVEEMCIIRGVRCEKIYPITVRKVFLGKQNEGERKKTKTAVLDKCKEYGYLPESCKDDNRADAVAIWHWAQIHYARWQPPMEMIMGKLMKVQRQ